MKRALLLAVVVIILAFGAATAAYAKPVVPEAYDVTLHEEGGRTIMVVAAQLPAGTKLPAEVALTSPSGWEIQWAGEILGGDLSDDISAQPKKTSADGVDTYSFTLTKALVGQLEVAGPAVTTFDGTTYAAAFAWSPPVAVDNVRMSLAIPGTPQVAAGTEGAKFVPVDSTGGYYSKTFTNVDAGAPLELAVNYSLPAAAPAQQPNPVAPVLLVLVALVLFAVAFVAISRKMRSRASFDDEDEESALGDLATPSGAVSAAVHEDGLESDTGDEAATGPESDEPGYVVPSRRFTLRTAIVLGVAAVLVGVGIAAGSRSSATLSTGGVVSRTFATGEACTQASIALTPQKGVDLEKSADEILATLATVPGVNTAALYVDESRVDIGYCDSSANEDQLRQALATSGLVTVD